MKGKRNLVFQFNDLEMDYTTLKKAIDKELKAKGIKYTDDVEMYFKIEDRAIYCVCNNNVVKVNLACL